MTIEEAKARMHAIFKKAADGIADTNKTLASEIGAFADECEALDLDGQIMAEALDSEVRRFAGHLDAITEALK